MNPFTMEKLKVVSVNISETKGTVKKPAGTIRLTHQGVENDAHSGPWNRQISILGMESIRKIFVLLRPEKMQNAKCKMQNAK